MSQVEIERLRVLRVITRLNVGGPALQAMLLTERLDPERYETQLVTGEPSPHEGNMLKLRPAAVRPIVMPGLAREIAPMADISALLRLSRIIRTYRPHIVHTHTSKAGLIGRLAARACGVPIIVHTFHGNVLRGYFDPFRSQLFLLVERALALVSTRVIAISPRQRAEISALHIAQEPKLVEIPLGIELTPFLDPSRGALRAELGLARDVPLVGIVGRLVPIKRVDVFIEAVDLARRSIPQLQAVIAGDGELRAHLTALVRTRGLDDVVRFIGWRSDLPSVYGDLDALVLTSDSEGTPVSVLEALAAKRPVVASAVGGVPDLIGQDERGLLVPPRQPTAIAAAIVNVMTRPAEAAHRAQAGRAYVYPSHDVTALIARIDRLYTEIASERAVFGPHALLP